METIKITLKAKPVNLVELAKCRLELAKWVYDNVLYKQLTLQQSLAVADSLIDRNEWKPGYLRCNVLGDFYECPYCNIEVVEEKSQEEIERLEYRDTQESYMLLLIRGAQGDAEAAIEYCKLDAAGVVNHAGMAF